MARMMLTPLITLALIASAAVVQGRGFPHGDDSSLYGVDIPTVPAPSWGSVDRSSSSFYGAEIPPVPEPGWRSLDRGSPSYYGVDIPPATRARVLAVPDDTSCFDRPAIAIASPANRPILGNQDAVYHAATQSAPSQGDARLPTIVHNSGAVSPVQGGLSRQAEATGTDSWRFRWHLGQWWYWTPENRWMVYQDNHWLNYSPQMLYGDRGPGATAVPGQASGGAVRIGGRSGGTGGRY